MEKSIRDLAPTIAVIYFLGVAIPVVVQQGDDLPPFPDANYVASAAVSGVTTGVSQQLLVVNSITGQLHVGDMPDSRVVDAPRGADPGGDRRRV
jgi:hypothetical protein